MGTGCGSNRLGQQGEQEECMLSEVAEGLSVEWQGTLVRETVNSDFTVVWEM